MHAQGIVHRFFQTHLTSIHRARQQLFGAAVAAVMRGHWLSLSRLGRGVAGSGTLKAALKRIDRLIGSARIEAESESVGAALIKRACTMTHELVIAVDWSAASPGGTFVELRASVTWLGMGRGLTVFQRVYPAKMAGSPKVQKALLTTLQRWIPAQMPVVFMTDAGFRRPWFKQVEELGWSWIGRIRGGVNISHDGRSWTSATDWFAHATGKAVRWINGRLTSRWNWPCDFVLYRRPTISRKHYCRPGCAQKPKAIREARARESDPWLLALSPRLRDYRPDEIVALYTRRMQIEENFRDNKSSAFGMGMSISRSRSALRLQALLLIATIAAFILWNLGQLAEAEGLHRRFKVTTRKARELSVIAIAILLCGLPSLPLTHQARMSLFRRLGISR